MSILHKKNTAAKLLITSLLVLAVANTVFFSHFSMKSEEKPMQAAAVTANKKEAGLMLDSARHFYPLPVLKKFIDKLAKSGGTFLHLHFSDHENYALESKVLNQIAADSPKNSRGVHINPANGKPFLSFAQLDELKAYAKSKNIELVPEVDSPNHMTTIFKLIEHSRGKEYVDSIKSHNNDDEIDITNPQSVALIKSLITEVADAFGDSSRHFHIGGDEFGYSEESNHEFVSYANDLAAFLKKRGLVARVWNDGIIKSTMGDLSRDIQVTYWSYDGNVQDEAAAQERRRMRASMPDLIKQGFSVLNYNSYYLYVTPEQNWGTSHHTDYATRDVIKRWHLGVWDNENQQNAIQDTDKIVGAALAVWGEYTGDMSSETIYKYTSGLLESIVRKTRSEVDMDEWIKSRSDASGSPVLKKSYLDWALVQDGESVDLKRNKVESLYQLSESALERRTGLNVWVQGNENSKVVLGSQWQKTDETVEKEGVDYQAYRADSNTLWVDRKVTAQMLATD